MDGSLPSGGGLAAFRDFSAELGDLKRIRDAASPDSLAVRAFRGAWRRLLAGEPASEVARRSTAGALVAMRLGGIDAAMLDGLGVTGAIDILHRAFDEVSGPLAPTLRASLRAGLGASLGEHLGSAAARAELPSFVEALIRQPRAGATCPGRPRIVLEPPENHGDHCLVVAVLGVALSAHYGADPATVFLAGLAHHLHNAGLPDSGFAGEILLGDELAPLMRRLFDRALAELPARLEGLIRAALGTIGDAETPEGRAFHAADVLDRVLQMHHYERVARFTAAQALDDLQLVHAGPVQAFHHAVLSEVGLSEAGLSEAGLS